MQGQTTSVSFDGREIRLTTGRYAPQAGGSVLIECGDTAVLVTATQANGNILIHQKMFESRLFFVDKHH